jgi:predicted RNA-binding protein with PIN domain
MNERDHRRWLVDGMNVIGSRPDGWWRDRTAAIRGLVESLGSYAEASGDPVTVVFDGEPRELPEAGSAAVKVIFAPRSGRDAADDEIVEMVSADADPSSLQVVTSDVSLVDRVRERGAVVVPSGSFRRRLEG